MTAKSIQIILARQLASSIATPILLVDEQNALIYYNEPAEQIFNQRFDETGEMPAAEWTTRFAAVATASILIRIATELFRHTA